MKKTKADKTGVPSNAKFVECGCCGVHHMCAPVPIAPGKWFWFCAGCARAVGCTWARVCARAGDSGPALEAPVEL